MTIEADDLILFAHVAAVGSFVGAARRTGMPKSTLSRRIAALEVALGERLLTRGTRALTLTEFGEGILEHGQNMLDELMAVSDLAHHRQVTPKGRLRVSLPPEFQELSLLPFLQEFVARYPKVHLELDVSPHRVDLQTGRFDLAIRIARQLPDDSTLVARPMIELPHGLYASPAYLSRYGVPDDPADLAKHVGLPLIGYGGVPQPWLLTRGDEHHEVMPCGPVAANSITLQGALAMGGDRDLRHVRALCLPSGQPWTTATCFASMATADRNGLGRYAGAPSAADAHPGFHRIAARDAGPATLTRCHGRQPSHLADFSFVREFPNPHITALASIQIGIFGSSTLVRPAAAVSEPAFVVPPESIQQRPPSALSRTCESSRRYSGHRRRT